MTTTKQTTTTADIDGKPVLGVVLPDKLPIIYRKLPSGKIAVWLLYLHIANITYSDACKSWFINFTNLSDEVHQYNSKAECDTAVRRVAAQFLTECLEQNNA